jgi:hypothetical protein
MSWLCLRWVSLVRQIKQRWLNGLSGDSAMQL